MKLEIKAVLVLSLAIGTLPFTFTEGATLDDSSAVTPGNSDNVQKTNHETSLDFCWLSLFLYTLVVVYIAHYLGYVLAAGQKGGDEAVASFAVNLLMARNKFKFILLSKLLHGRQGGLTELRNKLKRTESELQGPFVPKYELQKHRLADAILNGYIFPWYDTISDDQAFPICSRQVLLSAFTQLGKKLEQVDRTALAKEVILLLHCHWTEYSKTVERVGGNADIVHNFKAIHPYFKDNVELARQYQALISMLLKDVLVPELQSDIFCEFLSGVLVKGFVFYYANLISNPKWLNATLISLISLTQSSGKSGTELSSQVPSNSVTPEIEDRPKSANAILVGTSGDCVQGDGFFANLICNESKILGNQTQDDRVENSAESSPMVAMEVACTASEPVSKEEPLLAVSTENIDQPTISGVLGGLLSTAAMPLLPDGSRYELYSVGQPDQSLNSSTMSQTNEAKHEAFKEYDPASGAKFNLSNKTRHLSVKDTSRRQHVPSNCLEKATQSLDDTRIRNKLVSQEELAASNEPPDMRQIGSPICEGTEDFAATIAKLRSLLEQKKSRTDLNEMDESADTGEQNEENQTKDEKCEEHGDSNEGSAKLSPKEGSDGSLGVEGPSTSAMTQSCCDKLDITEDDLDDNDAELRRIFLNVVITKTETIGADSNAQSILFCIQYEGVYVEDGGDESTQRLVLRTTTVKRRFKEFLTLQNQLEENPLWKPHLKQIKTPTKWLTLSFPNMNSLSHKKSFLEKYLQQICYHPILGFSKELRQFMAYGEDGFQAFEILTSSSLSFQRLDKLAKTFTGVFHSLKDALPTFEAEAAQSPSPNSPNMIEVTEDKERFSPSDPKAKKMFASFFNFGEKIAAHRNRNQEVLSDTEKACKTPTAEPASPSVKISNGDCSSDPRAELDILQSLYSELQDKASDSNKESMTSSDSELILDGSLDGMYPLASVFTQFLCDVLWLPPQRPHIASIAAFMSISGKSLENYLQESLSTLLSEDAVTTYLEWLTCHINDWMVNRSSTWSKDEELLDCSQCDLKNCLRQKIPAWGRWMWGRKRLDVTIDRLSGFCQHSELNHDFVLSVVELLLSKIIDCSDEINENVISSEEGK